VSNVKYEFLYVKHLTFLDSESLWTLELVLSGICSTQTLPSCTIYTQTSLACIFILCQLFCICIFTGWYCKLLSWMPDCCKGRNIVVWV